MNINLWNPKIGELSQKTFHFKEVIWKAPNVLSLPASVGCFVQFSFADMTCELRLYSNGSKAETEGNIDVALVRLNSEILERNLKSFLNTC